MERLTISLDDDLAREFDTFIEAKGYQNRSEAMRDLIRAELERKRVATGSARSCVGVLSYVYDHHQRNLAARVTDHAHKHHDLVIATMHAHIDHDNCVEALIVRGTTADVVRFSDELTAQTGVRHGSLNLIPAIREERPAHTHYHLRPLT